MVETASASPATAGDEGGRAVLGTASGDTTLVTTSPDDLDEVPSGGLIYVDSMPSLETVLERLEVITAVIERPPPRVPSTTTLAEDRRGHVGLRGLDIFVLGGLPTGIAVAG